MTCNGYYSLLSSHRAVVGLPLVGVAASADEKTDSLLTPTLVDAVFVVTSGLFGSGAAGALLAT